MGAMATARMDSERAEAAAPRARRQRSRRDRVLGGVAGGIGDHLGVDPLTVRLAFAVLSLAAGFGLVVYLPDQLKRALRSAARPPAAARRTSSVRESGW